MSPDSAAGWWASWARSCVGIELSGSGVLAGWGVEIELSGSGTWARSGVGIEFSGLMAWWRFRLFGFVD